ncbi:MAG: tRNA lysidine(34) synthetase TilS [Oligoflexales bacterium]|nr:tRNA lysidine(34) synthetase TilS [Oligoflexales bacterium]
MRDELLRQNDNLNALRTKWAQDLPQLLAPYKGLVVACSGGLDSTALLHLLYDFSKEKFHFPLSIFHMNFGLRDESKQEQAFVEDLAQKLQLPFHSFEVPQGERSRQKGVQKWARELRYEKLQLMAERDGLLVALAHHEDDLAENVVLRMSRGSGPGSLAGMSEFFHPYWRPLLGVSRKELEEWAFRHKMPHCHDPSNDTIKYSRNFVRHRVLPQLENLHPGSSKRIARCARETQELMEFARRHVLPLIEDMKGTGVEVDRLRYLPNFLFYEVISCAIGRSSRKKTTHQLLENIAKMVKAPRANPSWRLNLPECRWMVKKDGHIFITNQT